jgi:hypothetical protein
VTGVRGGSIRPSAVTVDGVRPTASSWDAPSGQAAATEGIDAVHVVRPDRADMPELTGAQLDSTPRTRVVLLSEHVVARMS